MNGYKTYIVAAATAIYSAGIALGWWPDSAAVWGLLAAAGGASIRHAL